MHQINYQPDPLQKQKEILLNEYAELEWMSDNQPELMSSKQVKRLSRLRSQIIKELPNEYPC